MIYLFFYKRCWIFLAFVNSLQIIYILFLCRETNLVITHVYSKILFVEIFDLYLIYGGDMVNY